MYEPHGGRGVASVRVAAPFASARRASLLEEPGEEVDLAAVSYRPHEILTVLLS